MTMTQYNSSVPQRHQRRLSTVHLDGLSIPIQPQATESITEQQEHNRDVLMHALLIAAVLRSTGDPGAICIVSLFNVYIVVATLCFKSSDDVTQRQVHVMT